MITKLSGNILELNTSFIVIPVNCIGVMGKGLALAFKHKYSGIFDKYKKDCFAHKIKIGSILHYAISPEAYALLFPTKIDWRYPSKLEWIKSGLHTLKNILDKNPTKSIAIPPLGCGCGGLQKEEVFNLILDILGQCKNQIYLIDNK